MEMLKEKIIVTDWWLDDILSNDFWSYIKKSSISDNDIDYYDMLWLEMDVTIRDEYFYNEFQLFEKWLNNMNLDTFQNTVDIIMSGSDDIIDWILSTEAYIKVLEEFNIENKFEEKTLNNTPQNIKENATLPIFLDKVNNIDVTLFIADGYILVGGHDINKVKETSYRMISSGYFLRNKLKFNDPMKEKETVLYMFEKRDNKLNIISLN